MTDKIDYSKYDPEKAYLGVGKFKLPASHPFNRAGFMHDELYKQLPCQSTKNIDLSFLAACCSIAVSLYSFSEISVIEFCKLIFDAYKYYKTTRIWGTGRYAYAKLRGWKYLLRAE